MDGKAMLPRRLQGKEDMAPDATAKDPVALPAVRTSAPEAFPAMFGAWHGPR